MCRKNSLHYASVCVNVPFLCLFAGLQDSGFPPVGELRDPRPRRIWSRHTEMLLPLPKFKVCPHTQSFRVKAVQVWIS